ncbi:MAG TPA: Maf family protein [Verrucomicrobiae bacterium]|jgi:septum formation protein|nr:Maf family protein [Verrucomicrobiae bacterium]
MNTPTLILASASPRRADLLRQLGLDFKVVPSDMPELEGGALSAGEVAQINAYRKARAVSKKYPDAVTVGVDTVVVLGDRIFGKPGTLAEAEQMLLTLQGKRHQVVTGVCLVHLRAHHQKVFSEYTDVTFRPLTLEQIRHYYGQMNPLDKAGGYGIQDHGDVLVEAISGSFTNVIGLPLERFEAEWAAFAEPVMAA